MSLRSLNEVSDILNSGCGHWLGLFFAEAAAERFKEVPRTTNTLSFLLRWQHAIDGDSERAKDFEKAIDKQTGELLKGYDDYDVLMELREKYEHNQLLIVRIKELIGGFTSETAPESWKKMVRSLEIPKAFRAVSKKRQKNWGDK